MSHAKNTPNPKIKRYKNVARSELPDDFLDRPAEVLDMMAKYFRRDIYRIHGEVVSEYSDWAVRVELDPANALSVAEVNAAHNGRWVEFRGVVRSVGQHFPRAIMLAWDCADCGNVICVGPGASKPRACTNCKSRNIHEDGPLSRFIDSQHVLLEEDEPKGNGGVRVLECSLDGTLVDALVSGRKYVVGGVLRVTPATNGRLKYQLSVNNVELLAEQGGNLP